MIITLCKKTLHTFLGFSSSTQSTHHSPLNPPSPPGGLFLLAADCRKPANVLESSALKPSPPLMKKDPGELGLLADGMSGSGGSTAGVNGLSSCTESLGFESSDQMEDLVDYASQSPGFVNDDGSRWRGKKSSRERLRWREEVRNRKLPPPLSSLNQNGQSNFFLKPIRANGRLVLTEVKINRPEIFHVSRQDGRLRLHIAGTGSEFESESELELKPEPERNEAEFTPMLHEEKEEEEEEEERGGSGGGESDRIWKIPVTGRDGFRRCHEMRNHHHNHLPLWNHQCVTTR